MENKRAAITVSFWLTQRWMILKLSGETHESLGNSDYPIEKCQFPSVKVIQYKERNSQTIRFTRYTEFIGEKGA